jgi:hypothetical protein
LKIRRLGQAAIAVLALVTAVALPSAAWAAVDGPWKILPQNSSSKCVELGPTNPATGTFIDIYSCPGGITPLDYRWTFYHNSDGTVYIKNGSSGNCASTAARQLSSGALIKDAPCSDSLKWVQTRKSTGAHDYYQFQVSGQRQWCINVRGNSTANGTSLILYQCTSAGAANDLFTWIPAVQ